MSPTREANREMPSWQPAPRAPSAHRERARPSPSVLACSSPAPELIVMDFEVGHLISGKYRIVRRIGVGGMGSVYEAQHAGLGTKVALKVLLPQLAKVPTVADRFRREAQVSATLKSPHVIQVTDVDQLPDGRPYLVMELLEGESLQEGLEKVKALSREEAIDLGLQILLGLECAHALGVVHRDLKPGNVFLDVRGVGQTAKLLDFGVAKVKATPEFQAL